MIGSIQLSLIKSNKVWLNKKPDLSGFQWSKTFNDFPGGTGAYNNIAPLSHAVVLTECWGLTQTLDANGNGNGFAAACGQGIEGCREYLTGINQSTLNACEADPRTTWRGTAVHHDARNSVFPNFKLLIEFELFDIIRSVLSSGNPTSSKSILNFS